MKNVLSPPISAICGSLSLAALSLTWAAPAEAIANVTVNGTTYQLTTLTGSYDANVSALESTPWWGDENLAGQFAAALGGPNYQGLSPNSGDGLGPIFAYDAGNFGFGPEVAFAGFIESAGTVGSGFGAPLSASFNFVTVNATPVPLESDALPVVGSALFMAGGMWWKRKRAQAKANDFIAKQ